MLPMSPVCPVAPAEGGTCQTQNHAPETARGWLREPAHMGLRMLDERLTSGAHESGLSCGSCRWRHLSLTDDLP